MKTIIRKLLFTSFILSLQSSAWADKVSEVKLSSQELDYTTVDGDKTASYGTIEKGDYMLGYENERELRARGGVPNVLAKLAAGKAVTIGYLGGSITKANGWRPKTTDWLRKTYPESNITEVDASVNGTGANFGACRVGPQIIAHKPDLVFVEYAVNGGKEKHMEGIIRQIWHADPSTDIILVYTLTKSMASNYLAGHLHSTAAGFENVAKYYEIPTIAFGYQIVELEKQGRLSFNGKEPEAGKILFSKDGVHPTDDGALLYAGACARAFSEMAKALGNPTPHQLKRPLHADNWENAKMVSIDNATFSGNWFDCTADPSKHMSYGSGFEYTGGNLQTIKDLFPRLKGTRSPGAQVSFTFTGTEFGFMDAGGPFAAQLKVSIDGNPPITLSRATPWSFRIRHQYKMLRELKPGKHTVTITMDKDAPNKTVIRGYAEDPDKFKALEFYLGGFLILGE